MKKIKVLMVAGAMNNGGIENQLMHIIRNADKGRFQIDFTSTTPDSYYRDEIESLASKLIIIPRFNFKKPMPYIKALYNVMKNGSYDIVYSHELFHSGITLAIAKWAKAPCRFAHAHNWCDGNFLNEKSNIVRKTYNFVMQRSICRNSTVQVACSTPAGKFLYGEKMIAKPSYHLMYNSVDTTEFIDNYDSVDSELISDGFANVLNVARITVVKNQLFLLETARILKKRGSKIRILCAGDGDEGIVKKINDAILNEELGDYIKLLGIRSDIGKLMRSSNLFVLPSQYEGMPLVVIEAQSAGLPCLCADTFSHEVDFGLDLIEWKKLSDGAEAWADAIEKCILRPRADKESVISAIEKNGFDSKAFTQKICDLFIKDYNLRVNND